MAKKLEIYICETCGNIVEVLHGGVGKLVCCGKPMKLLVENTVDAAKEKHVPVIEKTQQGIKVKVGSVPHPMIDEHYIEWIMLITGSQAVLRFLEPGQEAAAEFAVSAESATARAYCNLHGLWTS